MVFQLSLGAVCWAEEVIENEPQVETQAEPQAPNVNFSFSSATLEERAEAFNKDRPENYFGWDPDDPHNPVVMQRHLHDKRIDQFHRKHHRDPSLN